MGRIVFLFVIVTLYVNVFWACSVDKEKCLTKSDAGLTTVPQDVETPEKWLQFSMDRNSIKELKDNAFSKYTSLKYLMLERNGMHSISPFAFNGTKIYRLRLNFNPLECVPDLNAISKTLAVLDMEYTDLWLCKNSKMRCTEQFLKLKYLYFNQNKLTDLPWIVFCTHQLRYLGLKGSKFTTLPDLYRTRILALHNKRGRIHLDKSPMRCDCNIHWMKEWEGHCHRGDYCGMHSVHANPPICHTGHFQGKQWRTLNISTLNAYCFPVTTTGEKCFPLEYYR